MLIPMTRVEGMKFAPIYDPNARRTSPKPMQVDLHKVFIIGTICWAIALIVSIIGFSMTHTASFHQAVFICGCGVLVGIVLLIWEHFDRSDYRRLGAD